MTGRWSDDGFLDGIRAQADPLADATVRALIDEHGIAKANQVFATLRTERCPLPEDTPGPLRDFLDQTDRLPAGVDQDRLAKGADAFMERAASGAMILLASSLPQGYGAPSLCEVLTVSDNLATHPYKRLMGVVQLLVNLATPGAFRPDGEAIVSAQKLRLLHAGVRTIVPKYRPDYLERFGPPSNHEDMLATIMAFSYLVVDGYRALDLEFEAAEDFYYSWAVFAQMMGIHPDGAPDDASFVPTDLTAAKTFYDAYSRRNYTPASENPHGPELAAKNLEMMENMIPHTLRILGFGRAPRVLMTELLTPEAMARVEIEPASTGGLGDRLLHLGLMLAQDFSKETPHLVDILARHVFQGMIDAARGGQVAFVIPDSLEALRGEGLV
ncbi:MAG: oxygenase MpaB family protein [Pseudomonadota bacterium]